LKLFELMWKYIECAEKRVTGCISTRQGCHSFFLDAGLENGRFVWLVVAFSIVMVWREATKQIS